jgi:hypothetical protein
VPGQAPASDKLAGAAPADTPLCSQQAHVAHKIKLALQVGCSLSTRGPRARAGARTQLVEAEAHELHLQLALRAAQAAHDDAAAGRDLRGARPCAHARCPRQRRPPCQQPCLSVRGRPALQGATTPRPIKQVSRQPRRAEPGSPRAGPSAGSGAPRRRAPAGRACTPGWTAAGRCTWRTGRCRGTKARRARWG